MIQTSDNAHPLFSSYKKTFTYSGRESRGPYSMLLLCQHVWFLLYLAVIASKMNGFPFSRLRRFCCLC